MDQKGERGPGVSMERRYAPGPGWTTSAATRGALPNVSATYVGSSNHPLDINREWTESVCDGAIVAMLLVQVVIYIEMELMLRIWTALAPLARRVSALTLIGNNKAPAEAGAE
jgi:hypothetical protein